MVTEFDLPCTACGQELTAASVPTGDANALTDAESVTVAECRNCGTRHYPEAALDGVRSRR